MTQKRAHWIFLLFIMSIVAPGAFGAGTEITAVDAVADGATVRIDIELTAPVRPAIRAAGQPSRLILDFPQVVLRSPLEKITVDQAGVGEVMATTINGSSIGTRIVVGLDSIRPFGLETSSDKLVLRILPHPAQANARAQKSASTVAAMARQADQNADGSLPRERIAPFISAALPEVDPVPVTSSIEETADSNPTTLRHRFKVKFIAGTTAYIDGGSNAGLRVGMNLDIRSADTASEDTSNAAAVGAARIVGIATTSAILEVGTSGGEIKIGDWADLLPHDADLARKNVDTGPDNTLHATGRSVDDPDDDRNQAQSVRSRQTLPEDTATRNAGRIGLDYSGISSSGSTPGSSVQMGMSFQSDMRHILGTHWNLEGYWRGRINRHSQFQEPTIEDSLNKTYTMQLYYANPQSKWVAGMGRLYLPWAVSLDTVDGGYLGHKFRLGNTSGMFAGSTPDLSSWHYRPNQRIAGLFTNFEGGDYDGLHYSSTTGLALTSIKWKLDRPFAFFENELSYKGRLSAYHSLIVDFPQGTSTNGLRPGAGISHSYFTLHYQPMPVVSFDLYHNFFRDVPTAVTSIVGTGLFDKLLFQGVSAGARVRPSRYFTLYTTLGTSSRTGDAHRSLNEMFGATLNEIPRTGLRADFHYSKFNSNFGNGHYGVLSLSRQVTNRMYWNVQLGKQDIESLHTLDCDSNFVDDSLDINLGRHSYLQSGYTYVRGETMNYRQWYMSWGFRFDEGKSNPQYIKTLVPHE
jgi:hypothetical protein